jgi:hypothetical protein
MIITEQDLIDATVTVIVTMMDGRSVKVSGEHRRGGIRPDPTSPEPDSFPLFAVQRPAEQYRVVEYERRVIVDMTLRLDLIETRTAAARAEP